MTIDFKKQLKDQVTMGNKPPGPLIVILSIPGGFTPRFRILETGVPTDLE